MGARDRVCANLRLLALLWFEIRPRGPAGAVPLEVCFLYRCCSCSWCPLRFRFGFRSHHLRLCVAIGNHHHLLSVPRSLARCPVVVVVCLMGIVPLLLHFCVLCSCFYRRFCCSSRSRCLRHRPCPRGFAERLIVKVLPVVLSTVVFTPPFGERGLASWGTPPVLAR